MLISTRATFPTGTGLNDYGSSRQHLVEAVDKALQRLGVEHIDLFQLHGQDCNTPVEEKMATLDQIVRTGKVRYIGGSNFLGWRQRESPMINEKRFWQSRAFQA